jgi:uncharacterized protein involved in exopolysaccharide biosynthesis
MALDFIISLIFLFGGVAFLVFVPPQYTASVLLIIDPRAASTISNQPGINDASMASARVESQVQVIESGLVLPGVVK